MTAYPTFTDYVKYLFIIIIIIIIIIIYIFFLHLQENPMFFQVKVALIDEKDSASINGEETEPHPSPRRRSA